MGVLSGILSSPVGVGISSDIIALTNPLVRAVSLTDGPSTVKLHLEFVTIGLNLIPLVVFVELIALGLRLFPNAKIGGFIVFGRLLDAAIKLVLAGCIIEYFTQICSANVGWRFDPIIADDEDRFRALEVVGYIGAPTSNSACRSRISRECVHWQSLGTSGIQFILSALFDDSRSATF